MGSGASVQSHVKKVYLEVDGRPETIEFCQTCSSDNLRDLLTAVAGISRWSTITLSSADGSLLPIDSSLPPNSPKSRYRLTHQANLSDDCVLQDVLSKVGEEFTRVFKIQEFTSQFSSRLEALERKVEGTTCVEVNECRQELHKLQGDFLSEQPTLKKTSVQSPHFSKYVLTQETVEYLKHPTFDIWHWDNNEMLCLLEHMYHELGIVSELNINPSTLRKWLCAVQDNYRDNPFHNFRHCFCVAQMLYGIIHLCQLQTILTKLELAIMLTSAVCHDLDHPGYNNNYQVNARTELAIRYNDLSPLENHHCAVAFQILEKPDTNIFTWVSPEHYKKIRTGIIELILATDMSKHKNYMERYKEAVSTGFDFENSEHKTILKIMLLKCCDISNEVRPMKVSEPWVDCLLEEYFMQSDREKSEGLPVAPFMDRDKVTKPSAQIGFINFVLLPVFQQMTLLFPQLEDAMLTPLKGSLEHYEQLKEKQEMLTDDSTTTSSNESSKLFIPLKTTADGKS